MNKLLLDYIKQERSRANIFSAADSIKEANQLIEDESYSYLLHPNHSAALRELISENPLVELPVIFQDIDRMVEEREEVFVDPPNFGESVPLDKYLGYQRRFLSLQFINDGERGKFLISRALHYSNSFYNQDELLDLIDRLYQNGWILGAFEASRWKLGTMCDGDMDKYQEICQDLDLIVRLSQRVKRKLEQAKEEAANLNEWFKSIHDLLPDAFLVATLAGENTSEESDKHDRYFDEVQADIGTTIGICTSAVVRKKPNPMTDIYYHRKQSSGTKQGKDLIRDIRYHYKARTILPKFWYEQAKHAIETNLEQPPAALDEYDHAYALGLAITLSDLDNQFMMFL